MQELQNSLTKINVKKFEDIKLENEQLKKEVELWKTQLMDAEKKLGQDSLKISQNEKLSFDSNKKSPATTNKTDKLKSAEAISKKTNCKSTTTDTGNEDRPVDFARLDVRVGKIVNVKKHPDADSLYVEEVDLGEGKFRTVVSGLVKFVSIEELKGRMVVALCNLKPAKMRGITSEAMVLCASTAEKVEVLIPPAGSLPGDKVAVEGFSGQPDVVLNPKKKIFETVAPDLKTDQNRVATYKGVPFIVSGKGVVTTQSLQNVQIK